MTICRAIPASFLLALANAQQTQAVPWIEQLADATPAVRAAARDALLALGVDAVAPLSAKLAQLTFPQRPASTGSRTGAGATPVLDRDGNHRSRRARNGRSTTNAIATPTSTAPTRYTNTATP